MPGESRGTRRYVGWKRQVPFAVCSAKVSASARGVRNIIQRRGLVKFGRRCQACPGISGEIRASSRQMLQQVLILISQIIDFGELMKNAHHVLPKPPFIIIIENKEEVGFGEVRTWPYEYKRTKLENLHALKENCTRHFGSVLPAHSCSPEFYKTD